jgi:hypothetical protein
MILSFVSGRIRARLTHLKGQTVPDIPVESLKGVNKFLINPLTGSVLLEYDPEAVTVETIASYLEPFDPQGAVTLRNPHLLRPRSLFGRPPEVPPEYLSDSQRADLPAPRHKRGSAEATSEAVNLGIAFLSCAASAFWGTVRTHTVCGFGLGLLLSQHVWKHRRRLRPLSQMGLLEILGIEIPKFLRIPQATQEYEYEGNAEYEENTEHAEYEPHEEREEPEPAPESAEAQGSLDTAAGSETKGSLKDSQRDERKPGKTRHSKGRFRN